MTVGGRDLPLERRSSCSRPRTRSSTRAPTRCPRRSSTGSCCAPARVPGHRRRVGPPCGVVSRGRQEVDAAQIADCQPARHAGGGGGRARGAVDPSLRRRARRGHVCGRSGLELGASPRGIVRTRAGGVCVRAAERGARLRGARRREGGGGAGAGPPAPAPARPVGSASLAARTSCARSSRTFRPRPPRMSFPCRDPVPVASALLLPRSGGPRADVRARAPAARARRRRGPVCADRCRGPAVRGPAGFSSHGSRSTDDRALEGDEIVAEIELERAYSCRPARGASARPARPRGRRRWQTRSASTSTPGRRGTVALTLRCVRWGSVEIGGSPHAGTRSNRDAPLGGSRSVASATLQIYPRPRARSEASSPRCETQLATGDLVARARADGLEFADTRAFVPGDRMRAVNWRASARRGALIVNERHPDRNADVVLFLDSFAEAAQRRAGRRHAGARGTGGSNARRSLPASAVIGSVSSRSAAFSAGSSLAQGSSSSTA